MSPAERTAQRDLGCGLMCLGAFVLVALAMVCGTIIWVTS